MKILINICELEYENDRLFIIEGHKKNQKTKESVSPKQKTIWRLGQK